MNKIKDFDEFIKKGIVKKQFADKSRAKFLIEESEQDYQYLLKLTKIMGISDLNANDYVKKCYDIVIELIRAKMLIKGLNASGIGAHEAEISYMKILGFKEREIQFADKMRFFRNGMLYYGTILDKEYAEIVIKFTKEIYPRLRNLIKED